MSIYSGKNGLAYLAVLLLVVGQLAFGQDSETTDGQENANAQQFGGPSSVAGQQADDARLTESISDFTFGERYFAWKDSLKDDHGFNFTLDYTTVLAGVSQTIDEDDFFAGGVLRFFFNWDLVERDSGNTGSMIFKLEHRHAYTDFPPQAVASQAGYVGLLYPTISDIKTRLTNLYWKHNFKGGDIELIGGFIDTTDWIDLYALASPWTGFSNFGLATGGASIPTPDDATLGVYLNAMLTDTFYISAGFADSNADSTDPFNGFDTFFDDHEFFKTIEFGWVTSRDRFYLDNTHFTFWHVDDREEAGVEGGWGATFSYSHSFDEKWMPFVRAGYAKDGGSLIQKTFSTGIGYHFADDISLLGVGFNWGEPNEGTFGPGLEDQYALELFARLQILKNLQVTPNIHLLINPARNPDVEQTWVFGVRARMYF